MMTNELLAELEGALRVRGLEDFSLEEMKVNKPFGTLDGLYVHVPQNSRKDQEWRLEPVFYPDRYDSVDELADYVMKYLEQPVEAIEFAEKFRDISYEDLKEYLILCVCDAQNTEYLKEVPHLINEEAGIAAYVRINSEGVTAAITYSMIEKYGLSEQEFMEQAITICEGNCSMNVIAPMLKMESEDEATEEGPEDENTSMVIVFSGEHGNYGAGVLFYHGFWEMVKQVFGEDVYIIPSSVNEVMVVPQSECKMPEEELSRFIRFMNGQLDQHDVFVDYALKLDIETGKIARCKSALDEGEEE